MTDQCSGSIIPFGKVIAIFKAAFLNSLQNATLLRKKRTPLLPQGVPHANFHTEPLVTSEKRLSLKGVEQAQVHSGIAFTLKQCTEGKF